jgi:hypothetical protein
MGATRVLRAVEGDTDIGTTAGTDAWVALIQYLDTSSKKLASGDLSQVETMLLHQASALQGLFVRLSERALSSTQIPTFDLMMRYGLRAQSQCRATLETLAAVKNPPMVFARQANVTTGPQQINNGMPNPTRAQENIDGPNKLSGEGNELRQNRRTPALAGPIDPPMASLGQIDGAANGGGQGESRAQCVEGRNSARDPGAREAIARTGRRAR